MAKQVSPGVLALRKVVDDVYADAREAKKQGKLVGWSSRAVCWSTRKRSPALTSASPQSS